VGSFGSLTGKRKNKGVEKRAPFNEPPYHYKEFVRQREVLRRKTALFSENCSSGEVALLRGVIRFSSLKEFVKGKGEKACPRKSNLLGKEEGGDPVGGGGAYFPGVGEVTKRSRIDDGGLRILGRGGGDIKQCWEEGNPTFLGICPRKISRRGGKAI